MSLQEHNTSAFEILNSFEISLFALLNCFLKFFIKFLKLRVHI
jgi:hypothetical protein